IAVPKSESKIPAVALAGYLNSLIAEGILGLVTPERHHKPSYVGQIPWLTDPNVTTEASKHYMKIVSLASHESPSELSPAFSLPNLLLHWRHTLYDSIKQVLEECSEVLHEIKLEQCRFDAFVLGQLGASLEDEALLREMSQRAQPQEWFPTEFSLDET